MPASTLLLLVEGPHDLEFCARLLKTSRFNRIQRLEQLSRDHPFWLSLVPKQWPQRGDLLARHPVPVFFSNPQQQSVAVVNANGLNKLATRLGTDLAVLPTPPDAIGIILDADDQQTPLTRYQELKQAIADRSESQLASLTFPAQPGSIQRGQPNFGVFIMPDNQSQGTLEDLLLAAGTVVYPDLLAAAREYVSQSGALQDLTSCDLSEINKPAGWKKACTAAMASILKPGKAIQTSIQDNRWLDEDSLTLPAVAAVKQFLDSLLA